MTRLLHQGVTAQAQARPESLAVVCGDARLTYGDLETASNRLAQLLWAAGCRPGERVALYMPKSPTAIVAMLGALKAGAVYVPMDPDSPAPRLARALALADCRFLLAAGRVGPRLREILAGVLPARRARLGWLDDEIGAPDDPAPAFTLRDLVAQPAHAPAGAASELALILFTSGSTGLPKGVTLTHAGVAHFLQWARAHFGIDSTDRISQHAPLRFDISTFDIYGALWSGAELHLVPAELNLLPHKLAQFIRESRLTQWFSVPAVLTLMAKFDVIAQGDFPSLRRVLFAGEVLPTPTLMHWMQRLPHARFTNLYGPTETTISSSYYDVPRCPGDARAPIPIGAPIPGEELLVLDAQMRPVPSGETGELHIAGAGLSHGYWRDPVRTAEAFVPRPGRAGERLYRTGDLARVAADGFVQFLGRADTQVKSRGHRIELGEIEAALHAQASLRESAVVAIASSGFEGALICCAFVPEREGSASADTLRKALAQLLPRHMLPARWLRCHALPKNESGKIDRVALRAAFQSAETPAEPARAARGASALQTAPGRG
jgi:amino acid adenylation domain-containing protein